MGNKASGQMEANHNDLLAVAGCPHSGAFISSLHISPSDTVNIKKKEYFVASVAVSSHVALITLVSVMKQIKEFMLVRETGCHAGL